MTENDWLRLVQLLMVLVLVVPAVPGRGRGGRRASAALWLGAFVALMFVYDVFMAP